MEQKLSVRKLINKLATRDAMIRVLCLIIMFKCTSRQVDKMANCQIRFFITICAVYHLHISYSLCICQSNMHDTLQQKPQAGKFVKISDKQEEVLLMVLFSSQSFSSALQPYHGTGVVLTLMKTFWTWLGFYFHTFPAVWETGQCSEY